MKKRIEYFGSNPVRYMRDAKGEDWVNVHDIQAATDPASLIEHRGNSTIN